MKSLIIDISLIVFIFIVGTTSASAQTNNLSNRPNIVFIASDDLNDWIGVMNGHPQVKTPNIDRLAKRGVLFTNAHAQAPLCNPSRVSILTGLRPTTTGIYGLAPRHREVERTKKVVTLPQYLAQHGYRTLSTGKILHGGITAVERATEFQEWGPNGGHNPRPTSKLMTTPLDMVNNPLIDWGVFPVENDSLMDDYKVATWAVEQLNRFGKEEGSESPFFLAVGFNKPHVPLYASQKWFDLYPKEELILPPAPAGDRMDIPDFAWNLHWYLPEPRLSWVIENEEWENKVRAYLATISFMDAQVGRVLDALEANKLSENTIVVFWSDHGYHLGEKDITGKNSLWEQSTNVPLIFAGPGITNAGSSTQAVELLDMYPTLLDLAALPENEDLEGISLKPQLEDVNTLRVKPAITTHNPGNNAVRTERWRYIRYADGSEELYDHYRDDEEWSNLAQMEEYAEVKAELTKWLPNKSASHALGSKHRVLFEIDGIWYWEDEPIVYEKLIK